MPQLSKYAVPKQSLLQSLNSFSWKRVLPPTQTSQSSKYAVPKQSPLQSLFESPPLHTPQSSYSPMQSSISSHIPSLSLSKLKGSFGQWSILPHNPSSSISFCGSKGHKSKLLINGSSLIIWLQISSLPTVHAHIPSPSISLLKS